MLLVVGMSPPDAKSGARNVSKTHNLRKFDVQRLFDS